MAAVATSTNDEIKTKSSRKNMTFLKPAPPDAPINIQRAASRYITVEPVLMLIVVGFGVMALILPQYLRYRVAIQQNVTLPDSSNGINGTCVARNTSNPYYVRLQDVQAEVAYWQMIITLSGTLPALFVAPFLGAWSDTVGRKVVLGLNTLGFVCYVTGFLLTYHLMLPIWVIPVSFSFSGLTGGYGLLNAQAFAYLSDVTNNQNRLLRIAILQGSLSIVVGVAQIGIGYLIRDYGYGPPLWMACIAICMALLYIIIPSLLIETVDRTSKRAENRNDKLWSSFIDGIEDLKLLFENNNRLRRWRLGLLYLIDFMREILERSTPLVIVYALGPPFCWSSVLVSGYTLILLFGSALAGFVGCFRNISQPLIPAMLAKIVSDDEHGVVFAFEASIQNLGSLISPVLLNLVYRKTVQTQPNFVFIMLGTLGFIPLILTTFLQVINRYSKRMEQQGAESTEKEGIENNGMIAMVEMGTMTD
ncbi:proton-coupled folate transporter-like [Amphiura filiformis]|uniref:proton-coupled folate transporter-like n=1 Tax=Amphiura filiformis TaxID=82378 RepID=UPI003B21ACC9